MYVYIFFKFYFIQELNKNKNIKNRDDINSFYDRSQSNE